MRRAYAFTRPVLNTYLTRERDRRRRRDLGWVLLTVLPVGLCGVVYVWLHFQTLAAGYSIPALERELEAQQEIERKLGLEAAALAAPEWIEARAARELGMEVPPASRVLFLEQQQ